jgi:ribosomal protein S18 acetylase RimI-like enzyme
MTNDTRHFTVSVEVNLRAAVEDDLSSLEWMGLYTPHRGIIRAAYDAQQAGDALLLVAISGGFPVAQVWIDYARKRHEETAVLWAVRTFFPLQGRGIGRRMMAAAEAEIVAHGIGRAELEVERSNKGALRFYKQCGWRMAGQAVERFAVKSEDGGPEDLELAVWLMEKDLLA